MSSNYVLKTCFVPLKFSFQNLHWLHHPLAGGVNQLRKTWTWKFQIHFYLSIHIVYLMDSHGSFFGTPLLDSPWKLCLSEIRALSPPLKINIVGGVTQIVFTQITWSEKPCWSDLGGKEVPRGRTFPHRFLEATRSSGGCTRCRLAPVQLHILFRNQGLLRFYRHIREIRKAIISPVCFENEHIMEFCSPICHFGCNQDSRQTH